MKEGDTWEMIFPGMMKAPEYSMLHFSPDGVLAHKHAETGCVTYHLRRGSAHGGSGIVIFCPKTLCGSIFCRNYNHQQGITAGMMTDFLLCGRKQGKGQMARKSASLSLCPASILSLSLREMHG